MRRWLRRLATIGMGVSLAICLAAIVFGVWSYWASGNAATRIGDTWYGVHSEAGRVSLGYCGSSNLKGGSVSFDPRWHWESATVREGPWRALGIDCGGVRVSRPGVTFLAGLPSLGSLFVVGGDGWFVRVPWLLLAALGGVWPGARWVAYVRRRRRVWAGRCAWCGYDLRATPGRCPECGLASKGVGA